MDYPKIEYFIIDGNSNNGTSEVIRSDSDKISCIISDPDKSMYDAIKIGLKLSNGNIIGLMHSDDEFFDTTVVSKIVTEFKKNSNTNGM